MKASDIIREALELATITAANEEPKPEDVRVAQRHMQTMLDGWSIQPLTSFTSRRFNVAPVAGSVTVGPLGIAAIPKRPPVIQPGVYWADGDARTLVWPTPEQVFLGLDQNKNGTPCSYYYEPSQPLGVIHLLPVPTSGTLVFSVLEEAPAFSTLNADVDLPQGYRQALVYNLAIILGPIFHKKVDPDVRKIADAAKNNIEARNFRVPELCITNASIGSIDVVP